MKKKLFLFFLIVVSIATKHSLCSGIKNNKNTASRRFLLWREQIRKGAQYLKTTPIRLWRSYGNMAQVKKIPPLLWNYCGNGEKIRYDYFNNNENYPNNNNKDKIQSTNDEDVIKKFAYYPVVLLGITFFTNKVTEKITERIPKGSERKRAILYSWTMVKQMITYAMFRLLDVKNVVHISNAFKQPNKKNYIRRLIKDNAIYWVTDERWVGSYTSAQNMLMLYQLLYQIIFLKKKSDIFLKTFREWVSFFFENFLTTIMINWIMALKKDDKKKSDNIKYCHGESIFKQWYSSKKSAILLSIVESPIKEILPFVENILSYGNRVTNGRLFSKETISLLRLFVNGRTVQAYYKKMHCSPLWRIQSVWWYKCVLYGKVSFNKIRLVIKCRY